jgi:hypothetical protein
MVSMVAGWRRESCARAILILNAKAWVMTPLLRLAQLQGAMLSMALLFASATLACEKHLERHQNSSEAQSEGRSR